MEKYLQEQVLKELKDWQKLTRYEEQERWDVRGNVFPAKGPTGSMFYPTTRPLYARYCGKRPAGPEGRKWGTRHGIMLKNQDEQSLDSDNHFGLCPENNYLKLPFQNFK